MEQESDLVQFTKLPIGIVLAVAGVALFLLLFFETHYIRNICTNLVSKKFASQVLFSGFIVSFALIVIGIFGQVAFDLMRVLVKRITSR